MAKKQPPNDVSIGKFDILATYAYAQALLDGMTDDEAKQRGMVAAIMGAQARLGIHKEHHEEFQAQKEAAEKKKKTTITAESFDKQVAHKMGRFFDVVFLPFLRKLVEAGLSSCVMDAEIPVPVVTPHGVTQGVLATHLELGDPAPNGGIDREYLSPRLGFGDRVLTSRG